MPATMQQRILDALTSEVESADRTPTVQFAWANTGHLYAQKGFRTEVDIDFSFQDTYCSLEFRGPAVDALELVDSPPLFRRVVRKGGKVLDGDMEGTDVRISFYSLQYADGERIEAMLSLLRWALTGSPE